MGQYISKYCKINAYYLPTIKRLILSSSSTISLFITGIKRQLSEEDLLHPLKSQKSKYMGDALAESWKKEITNYKHPSLWRALFRMFMPTYSVLVLITLVTEISK